MIEAKLFNNIYSQTQGFDDNGMKVDDYQLKRSTYFTGNLQVYYGLSNRVNLGMEVSFRSVLRNPETASQFEVFKFTTSDSSRTGFSSIGPKVKFAPVSKLGDFTIQSALLFPLASDPEGRGNGKPFFDFQRFVWLTSFFYNKLFARDKFQFFGAVEIAPRVDTEFEAGRSDLIMFNKAIISYFPSAKFTVYGLTEFTPTFGLGENDFFGYYGQAGLGLKYIPTRKLILEVLYTKFLVGKNQGAGQTLNLGIVTYLR